MRAAGYGLMEIVAWPAVAWGAVEMLLRLAAREPDGAVFTLQLTLCAAGSVLACRWRRRQLQPLPKSGQERDPAWRRSR